MMFEQSALSAFPLFSLPARELLQDSHDECSNFNVDNVMCMFVCARLYETIVVDDDDKMLRQTSEPEDKQSAASILRAHRKKCATQTASDRHSTLLASARKSSIDFYFVLFASHCRFYFGRHVGIVVGAVGRQLLAALISVRTNGWPKMNRKQSARRQS